MELHEQLKKIENDLKKMEEKKKNFLEEYEARRKKLLGKKQAVLDQITKEKNEKILSAIEKKFWNFGRNKFGGIFGILRKKQASKSRELFIRKRMESCAESD